MPGAAPAPLLVLLPRPRMRHTPHLRVEVGVEGAGESGTPLTESTCAAMQEAAEVPQQQAGRQQTSSGWYVVIRAKLFKDLQCR